MGKSFLSYINFFLSFSDNIGYFEWSQGRYEEELGQKDNAIERYRESARSFFEKAEYNLTLELLSLVKNFPPWSKNDDHIYEKSIEALPSYFSNEDLIKFALLRQKWNEIKVDYLKDEDLAPSLFLQYRENVELKKMIETCSKDDLAEIECSLPILVADYYFSSQQYFKATKLYLLSNCSEQDCALAEEATNLLIQSPKTEDVSSTFENIASAWHRSGKLASDIMSKDSDLSLLLQLYKNPLNVATRRQTYAYGKFGPDVIKSAFKVSNGPLEELHNFSRNQFEADVDQALSNKYKGNHLIEAVQWYLHRHDEAHAEKFAARNMNKWAREDLLAITRKRLNPKGLIDAADKNDCLVRSVFVFILALFERSPLSDIYHLFDDCPCRLIWLENASAAKCSI